jgi:hypothetical protein
MKQLYLCDSVVIDSFVRTGYTTRRWGWLLGRRDYGITRHYPLYPRLLWNRKVPHRVCKNPPPVLKKLSHYTPWRRLGGEEIYLLILDLGCRWGEWSASRPGRALPPERTLGTRCTGGWVGLRAGLDTEAKGKILSPLPVIEPRSSSP